MTRLPEQWKADIPQSFATIHDALHDVSGVMIRYTLQYHGLETPAVASVAELQRLAVAYLEDGKLSRQEIHALVLDGQEYSAKRSYLFRTDPKGLAAWEAPEQGAVVASRLDGNLKRSTGPERLCYIALEDDRIRAVFTELHHDQFVDLDAEKFEKVPVQKVIVLEANRETGFVTVLLDAPGRRQPHGHKLAYFRYWKQRAAAFFQVNLTSFPLMRALSALEKEKRIKIPFTQARTAHGKFTLAGIEADDVRGMPEFKELEERRIAHDRDAYTWLPQEPVPPATIGIPLRDVKTDIVVSAGEVRFMQHVLGREVEYVLGQLQAHV